MRSAILMVLLSTLSLADCESTESSHHAFTVKSKQLSIDDIKRMTQTGVSDDKIISRIRSTGSIFYLSSSDIDDLKKSGVSQRVIDYMMQTGYQ